MSIYTFLKKLQKKPEREKRVVLTMLMGASVLIVGGLWLATLDSRFSRGGVFTSLTQAEEERESAVSVAGRFASLRSVLSDGFKGISDQVDKLGRTPNNDETQRNAYMLPIE